MKILLSGLFAVAFVAACQAQGVNERMITGAPTYNSYNYYPGPHRSTPVPTGPPRQYYLPPPYGSYPPTPYYNRSYQWQRVVPRR